MQIISEAAPLLTVIIPSHNEENYIGNCLQSLARQRGLPKNVGIEVIVAANGCTDRTVAVSDFFQNVLGENKIELVTLDIEIPGKSNAIRLAEQKAKYRNFLYIDADVTIEDTLLSEILTTLSEASPIYVSGTLAIPTSQSWISANYAKIWLALPFVNEGVPGIGLYGVNEAGRKRWGDFPQIIADDRFVRLNFAESERRKASSRYFWSLPQGARNLTKARIRWCEGNEELKQLFPELLKNDTQRNDRMLNLRHILKDPVAGVIFIAIYATGRAFAVFRRPQAEYRWRRARK